MILDYITGNKFREHAHYIFDQLGYRENKPLENSIPIFFVKTDLIDTFFSDSNIFPKQKFILITHNSDHSINTSHTNHINHPRLIKWFAQNVDVKHHKLIPIPIGIANNEWPHGKVNHIIDTIDQNYKKSKLMYANFRVGTNPLSRNECLKYIDPEFIDPKIGKISFREYLNNLSEAYYNICPLGNGIDTHRIWESLYLKTIPIVEKTYNISTMANTHNLPIIFVNDWSELTTLSLNQQTYEKLMHNFDPSILNTELFLKCLI